MFFFFFTAPPPTDIYTLSLHDALPIFATGEGIGQAIEYGAVAGSYLARALADDRLGFADWRRTVRSEEHTSELQSLRHLVCRLLLEKKKKRIPYEHERRQ